jgi:hypothetical protein
MHAILHEIYYRHNIILNITQSNLGKFKNQKKKIYGNCSHTQTQSEKGKLLHSAVFV